MNVCRVNVCRVQKICRSARCFWCSICRMFSNFVCTDQINVCSMFFGSCDAVADPELAVALELVEAAAGLTADAAAPASPGSGSSSGPRGR